MSVREYKATVGRRQGQDAVRLIGREIRSRRRTAGITQARLAAAVGLSQAEIARVEAGAAPWLTVLNASSMLSTLGLRLSVKVYPAGPPLRDAGHLRLLADLEARVSPDFKMRRERPLSNDAFGRAVDLQLWSPAGTIGVEAETNLSDLQELERELNLKQAGIGAAAMVLLVRSSRRNREILRAADALRRALPVPHRTVMAALAEGRIPPGNGIVVL